MLVSIISTVFLGSVPFNLPPPPERLLHRKPDEREVVARHKVHEHCDKENSVKKGESSAPKAGAKRRELRLVGREKGTCSKHASSWRKNARAPPPLHCFLTVFLGRCPYEKLRGTGAQSTKQ